jgi:hypothetical protein
MPWTESSAGPSMREPCAIAMPPYQSGITGDQCRSTAWSSRFHSAHLVERRGFDGTHLLVDGPVRERLGVRTEEAGAIRVGRPVERRQPGTTIEVAATPCPRAQVDRTVRLGVACKRRLSAPSDGRGVNPPNAVLGPGRPCSERWWGHPGTS